MERTLVTAFPPLGAHAKDEGPLVLVQLVLSPLQVKAFVRLALDCPMSPFPMASPRCIVDCAQSICALRKCWRLVFVVGLSLFLSPPSNCFSPPSMMTWTPCPHGVRTRGKKICALRKFSCIGNLEKAMWPCSQTCHNSCSCVDTCCSINFATQVLTARR